MKTWFNDPDDKSWELPEQFLSEDVRLCEAVIERFILKYTNQGERVLDPFAGFGTVLVVCERLGRQGLGFEIMQDRVEYANSILSRGPGVMLADLRDSNLELPPCKLCISSPPYMNRCDPENPLDGYSTRVSSYQAYVSELAAIYLRLGNCLAPEGRLIIQIQNLVTEQYCTALAFDLYGAIGAGLEFVGEEVMLWDKEVYGYNHGYCLIYKAPQSEPVVAL